MDKCKKCGFEFSVPFFKKLFGIKENICQNCKIIIQSNLKTYITKVQEFGSDNYLSPEEEAKLKKLKIELELTDEDLIKANESFNKKSKYRKIRK